MMRRSLLITAAVVSFAASVSAQADRLSQTPDAKNWKDWLAFIRPSDSELSYEDIGWRNAFWPAVEEARKLGRPILLWTMNGHPLGCT